MGAIFAPGGALSIALDGFEARRAQIEMAAAVADVFAEGGVLLAEAGTGTGKTLAYLVPAILSRERVLISTGTKNLQEQIFFKDLPVLRDTLGIPFTAAYMKGRGNYLCLHRFEALKDSVAIRSREDGIAIDAIDEWSKETQTGDRAEMEDLPEDFPLWPDIAATSENCIGADCPRFNDCHVTKMRQRAAESDVVIVNHHLLCADASVRQSAFGEVIPSCRYAIVDEAHQLEDVATQYFGVTVSSYRIDDLVRDAERTFARWPDPERREPALRIVERIGERGKRLFDHLEPLRRSAGEERTRVTLESLADVQEPGSALMGALEGLEAAIQLLKELPSDAAAPPPGMLDDLLAVASRASAIRVDLRLLLGASDPDFVFFIEVRGRGVFFRAAPIDVSRIVREHLLERFGTTVLTSATLTVEGSFEYLRGRLGIRRATEVCLPSEFDFRTQAVLYLPKRMPSPKDPGFADAVARECVGLLGRTEGRAFVLFTSYAMLRAVEPVLASSLDYPLLVQGRAPRSALLAEFRATPHAVLLATSSFWQGVDVVGEALSCVIIDKLPFASPGDPVTAARMEALNAQGGDSFADYQVPLAILTLLQGLGRLIRHRHDRGVLAVLDPRLRTMGYGRRFLASMPPAPVTHDLEAVGRFFAS